MGDLRVFLPQSNGSWGDGSPSSSPLPLQSLNPHPHAIGIDSWRRAEQITQKIIWGIQPTTASEGRRRDVIEYVQTLMKRLIGCEVFSFGSVPLKTYLPDGDIDLTAFGPPNFESSLANDVCAVLEGEEQNNAAVFEVKDVQYIHAEVKLVKCLVQNIIVDISFNQIGGLCTLCFLEHVDQLIGKDNLFKRSILLIKAWCYYESRILGAHHGLISTYALETLVLYIFHHFHSSLDGPLAVLYRFLDYFGKFDWDNKCISLRGPVSLSSVSEIAAEAPEPDAGALLFTPEFLKQCAELYSVPPRGIEKNSNFRTFSAKHLNIVDPLRENNNLGRSVSKGSFYRIRSAFAYGARKLGRILLLPGEDIVGELNKFFMNTLDRHRSGERPDVQDAYSDFDVSGSVLSKGDSMISEASSVDSHDGLCENLNSITISGLEGEKEMGVQPGRQPCDHHLRNCLCSCTEVESNDFTEGNVVSGIILAVDANDLATSRAIDRIHKRSTRNVETVKAHHAPHLLFYQENGVIGNGNPDQLKTTESGAPVKEVTSARSLTTDEDISLASGEEPYGTESSSSEMLHFCSDDRVFTSSNRKNGPLNSSGSTCSSENLCPATCSLGGNKGIQDPGSIERELGWTSECPEAYGLSDLSSDFDTHFGNLLYAQTAFYDHEYMVGWPVIPMQPPSPHFHHKSWDAFHRQNTLLHMNVNGAVPRPPISPHAYIQMNPTFMSGAYGMEDVPRPRGTGTYFPNTSHHSYRARREPPRSWNNGRGMTPPEANLTDKVGQEQHPQAQTPVFSGNGRGKSPTAMGLPLANGFTPSPGGRLEFGSFRPVQLAAVSLESDKNLASGDSHNQGSVHTLTEHKPGTSSNCNRVSQLYLLKDENHFPPLSETKGG